MWQKALASKIITQKNNSVHTDHEMFLRQKAFHVRTKCNHDIAEFGDQLEVSLDAY